MDKKEIRKAVADAFEDRFLKKVEADTRIFDDLEADSLDLVQICNSIKEELGVRLDYKDLLNVETVGDVIDLVAAKEEKV